MQSLVLSQLTGIFPPFTLLNCSGLLWKLLLMSKTIQKLAQTVWRSSTNPYNIYQQKLWFTRSVNYFCIKAAHIVYFFMYIYIENMISRSLSLCTHTGYCKQFWSEQSDKCRYSCIKNSSQLGCVSTRLLFLSATARFPIVVVFFSMEVANNHYGLKCCIQHHSYMSTSGT